MHKILQKQIKKHLVKINSLPAECKRFLMEVDATYKHFDENQKLLENSLVVSSEELNKKNKKLQDALKNMGKDLVERERFSKLAVDRELRMIELKKKIKQLEEKLKK